MLRVASKKSVEHGLKGVRNQTNQASTPPVRHAQPKKKSGGLKLAVGAITVGTAGVVGYSYVDPEFRAKVENTVPQVKPVLDMVLGDSNLDKQKHKLSELKEQVVSSLPKKKEVLPPLPVSSPPLPEVKKAPVVVDPVDIKKEVNVVLPKPTVEQQAAKNKHLESALVAAIQAAERCVHDATHAKMNTIAAINDHAKLLKSTVDDAQNADWEKVTTALQRAEALSRVDSQEETNGRNFVDALNKIIIDGRTNDATASNPLLINATETVNKLKHQLDEMNGLVQKARQESQILNQYKDLIERSRQQFALEMKSILPNVDVHAKDKKLNEDELNALIAHAHLKVDQLRRQLSEQQVREEQHIIRAIEDQRSADERIAAENLHREIVRVNLQKEQDVERAVSSHRSSWEVELEDHLKRAAAAHSEHLEQVIRTQRQLFDIEHTQKVEEAVLIEREHHSRTVGAALSRLEGIEHALNSRVALDAENRKSKQVWVACHNLIDYIKHGNKAGNDVEERRLPLAQPLSVIKEINPDDEFANVLINSIPEETKQKGVYTEQDLRNRFDTLYKLGKRTASIDANGGSLMKYIWSYAKSLVLLEVPRKFSDSDKIDPEAINNNEVLIRAKWLVTRGDFEGAIKILQLLRGQSAELAQDWVKDARVHLETRLLAELLVAHAAVTSIRSTY